MWIILAIVAAAGFVLSAIVHGSTYFGEPSSSGVNGLLHTGAIALVLPIVLISGSRSLLPPETPLPLKVLGWVLVAYAVSNFLWSIALLQGGTPEFLDGRYVLHSHGRVIKELTLTEYGRDQGYVRRLFSGHWLVFHYAAFVGYFVKARRA
jgi:hypothetical protein